MRKYLNYALLIGGFVLLGLIACQKEEIKESASECGLVTDNGDTRSAIKDGGGVESGLDECGLCRVPVEVCIAPSNFDSWVCHNLNPMAITNQDLSLMYYCDGELRQISLMTINAFTPVEEHCFTIDLPINTPVFLGVGNTSEFNWLCNAFVRFTSGKGTRFECISSATYNSYMGDPPPFSEFPTFEICSYIVCHESEPPLDE